MQKLRRAAILIGIALTVASVICMPYLTPGGGSGTA